MLLDWTVVGHLKSLRNVGLDGGHHAFKYARDDEIVDVDEDKDEELGGVYLWVRIVVANKEARTESTLGEADTNKVP